MNELEYYCVLMFSNYTENVKEFYLEDIDKNQYELIKETNNFYKLKSKENDSICITKY